jgi:hypothetical protein
MFSRMEPGPEGNQPVEPQRGRTPRFYDVATVLLRRAGRADRHHLPPGPHPDAIMRSPNAV